MSEIQLVSFEIISQYLKLTLSNDNKYCSIMIKLDNISSFIPSNNLNSLYIKYYDSYTLTHLKIKNDFEICNALINGYLKWKNKDLKLESCYINKGLAKKGVAKKGKDLFQTANILLSLNNSGSETNSLKESISLPPKKSLSKKNNLRKHKMVTRSMVR